MYYNVLFHLIIENIKVIILHVFDNDHPTYAEMINFVCRKSKDKRYIEQISQFYIFLL